MKTKLLLSWRVLVASGMIAILFFVGLVTYEYIKDNKRQKAWEYYTCKSRYSNNYVLEWHKGSVRLKDVETKKYLTPTFDNIYDGMIKDTLTVFFYKNKRGFLDVYTGKIVIPAQYEKAWVFSEGLGAVVKDNKLGFVNKTGELVIPCQFNWKKPSGETGEFLFKDGYCIVFNSLGKRGVINKTGEWVLQPEYDYISDLTKNLRIVYQNEKYGLLNTALQPIFPTEYDRIVIEDEGIIVSKGSDQKLYDFDGKTILQSFVYNDLSDLHYNSGQVNESGEDIYVKSDYMSFSIRDKVGLMNKNGKVIVPAIYKSISAIDKDLFSCGVASYEFNITINSKGEIIQ